MQAFQIKLTLVSGISTIGLIISCSPDELWPWKAITFCEHKLIQKLFHIFKKFPSLSHFNLQVLLCVCQKLIFKNRMTTFLLLVYTYFDYYFVLNYLIEGQKLEYVVYWYPYHINNWRTILFFFNGHLLVNQKLTHYGQVMELQWI